MYKKTVYIMLSTLALSAAAIPAAHAGSVVAQRVTRVDDFGNRVTKTRVIRTDDFGNRVAAVKIVKFDRFGNRTIKTVRTNAFGDRVVSTTFVSNF